jgi:hypothetical protein
MVDMAAVRYLVKPSMEEPETLVLTDGILAYVIERDRPQWTHRDGTHSQWYEDPSAISLTREQANEIAHRWGSSLPIPREQIDRIKSRVIRNRPKSN